MANNRIKATINPYLYIAKAWGLPADGIGKKKDSTTRINIKPEIKKSLRIMDMQNHITRFKWYNLPPGITGNMIEQMLYYRGQVCLFYFEPQKKFFVLPYVLDGNIDVYGRYEGISPLPYNGSTEDKNAKPWIPGYTLKPQYDVVTEPLQWKDLVKSAVIIYDETHQLPQTIEPRYTLAEPYIDSMANCIPLMNTALFNNTGITGLKIGSTDEQVNVQIANDQVNEAALTGLKFLPIVGNLEFQEISGTSPGRAEEFLLSMQALDNIRLKTLGLENGGIFQKKAQELQAEAAINGGKSESVLEDALYQRQHACTIFNSLWDSSVWVEINEVASGGDMNMDGLIGGDSYDGEYETEDNSGEETEEDNG